MQDRLISAQVLLAVGKARMVFAVSLIWLTVKPATSLFLALFWGLGLPGLGVAAVLAQLITTSVTTYAAYKTIQREMSEMRGESSLAA